MATAPVTPMPPMDPSGSPGDSSSPPSPVTQMAGNSEFLDPAKQIAKLGQDAKKVADSTPEFAPMARMIQDQVNQGLRKLVQKHLTQQQPTPSI